MRGGKKKLLGFFLNKINAGFSIIRTTAMEKGGTWTTSRSWWLAMWYGPKKIKNLVNRDLFLIFFFFAQVPIDAEKKH